MTSYKEGEKIQFTIKKLIEFSEDEKYYVLEDKEGQKHLLTAEYYENYNFKIGQNIVCRIDHINCSGKIFLEPEHPLYKEGEIYEFTLKTIKKSKNRLKENILRLNLKDKFGNKATCITENSETKITIGETVRYKILRIKKGQIYLRILNEKPKKELIPGVYYKFKIEAVNVLNDGFKYYILSDKKKRKHLLRYDYYRHHNMNIGDTIECTVIKFSPEGYSVLEPKHPFYKVGKKYDFEFVSQEKDFGGEITGNFNITVKDIYGEEVIFLSPESVIVNDKKPDTISCSVNGIKKGKPLLSVS